MSHFAEKEFEREVKRQFSTSGINFEGSLPYHRLSSEISLMGVALIKKSGIDVPQRIVERLKMAADFTRYYADTCEECPIIGDNDSGIVVKLFDGQELHRHQYLKYLFNCILEDKCEPKNLEEFLYSIHFTNRGRPDTPAGQMYNENVEPILQVRDFDGLVIARHKSEALFFNTLHAPGGHTHNDKLSIYPVIGKKLVFIDRGSFSYTGFKEKRHQDRTTSSHNGPVINGWEQSKIWKDDVFYMNGDAKCYNNIDLRGDLVVMTGWHAGYGRYRKGLKTFRRIKWDIRKRTILIADWVEGNVSSEKYQFTWKYLINPAWIGEIKDGSLVLTNADQTVRFENKNEIKFSLSQEAYCPAYQVEFICQALTFQRKVSQGQKINFNLYY